MPSVHDSAQFQAERDRARARKVPERAHGAGLIKRARGSRAQTRPMSSSRYLDLLLHTSRCRGSVATRHAWRTPYATLSTSTQRLTTAGSAYVQKPDKTHPVPTHSVPPAKASQTEPSGKGKQSTSLRRPKKKINEQPSSVEDQWKEIERLNALQHILPFDIWSQPVGLLGELCL